MGSSAKDSRARQNLIRWKENPHAFVTECIGAKPSHQQAEGLEAFAHHNRVSIRSGHGTGKDAWGSWCIQNFLGTRSYPKILCTGPTAHQLRNVLWSEINKWLRKSKIGEQFVWNSTRIYHKQAKEEWFATYVTARPNSDPEEQSETLAGFHADSLLIVIDEASGVHDAVFLPLEGAMTQPDNKAIMIGNMTRRKGYFYNSHFDPVDSKKWCQLHWDSEESELVSRDYVEYMEEKYGRDSNVFRIRVKGEPPLADEEHTAIVPLAWALQCVGNEIIPPKDAPGLLGVDVARYGDDISSILHRVANVVPDYEGVDGMNTMDLADMVRRKHLLLKTSGIAVDEIGVGAGVTDWLEKRLGPEVAIGVNVARRPSDRNKYYSLRDELWWDVRTKCMRGVYSFPAGDKGITLAEELASPRYAFVGSKIKVESKKDMRNRGIKSPNHAEALLLTEYIESDAYIMFKESGQVENNTGDYEELYEDEFGNSPDSWMVV